jgi:CDP-archaeol synthase
MMDVNLHSIFRVLVMLAIANGAPVIAKRLLGDRLNQPLDCQRRWLDQRRLLGPSKTIRGVIASIAACLIGAYLIGIDWMVGAGFGAMSMIGDILSSFVKRRMNIAPSGQAVGLDQIPEALLPTLLVSGLFGLSAFDVVLIVAAFWLASVVFSPLFHWIGLRDRPY